ncbi:MAG: transglycosylase SLT domain-containing protein [Candidatus Nanoarchaeia archaeon]
MEREEIVGAIIVLVIIVVVALIVYSMHGSFGEEVKRIADEVFGWAKQEQKAETEKYGEAEAIRLAERLKTIYQHSLTNQNKDCTYDMRGYSLPEKFKIEIAYINSETSVVKFNILKVEDEMLIESKTVEDKSKEGFKLSSCFMENPTTRSEGGDRIQITYTTKKGLMIGTRKFYDELPKLYKQDQNHLCFITQPSKKEAEYKKYFMDAKDCETDKQNGAEKAKDFFNMFMSSIKRCKSFAKNTACQCEPIYFDEMPDGTTIKGIQKDKDVIFELYYNNKKVDVEGKIPDTVAGSMDEGFFETKPTFTRWTQEKKFTRDMKTLYVALTQNNELAMATPRAARAEGAFLRWAWAESLPSCSEQFYEVFERGCTRKMDPSLILQRIQDKGYDKIIKTATSDNNERELVAAIIATESAGINERPSETGCRGLMQFCSGTAKGYNVPCEKGICYVCDPKGCNQGDNRETPEIAIPAGLKLLKEKINYFDTKCKNAKGNTIKYTYREIFGIAAYNGGEGTICNAIKATGKDDPTWGEVKKELDRDVLKNSGYTAAYWTKTNLDKKVNEIKCYPYYVQTFRTAYTGKFA